jgi:hypothetical protein
MGGSYAEALLRTGQESESGAHAAALPHAVNDGPQPPAEWPPEMAEKFTKLLLARRTGTLLR